MKTEICTCEEDDAWLENVSFEDNECGICLKPIVDKSNLPEGEIGEMKGFNVSVDITRTNS